MSRDYLTSEDILAIHSVLLKNYGGAEGIRDKGLLEAAIFRPQCGYYADLIEEACALMESLLFNHPFIDGNKRTAFAACDVFLDINGHRITAPSDEIYSAMITWIQSSPDVRWESMLEFLRSNTAAR